MNHMQLIIGDKSLSSWSMRPWFALRHAGLPFTELMIPLDQPGTKSEIAKFSPSNRVPLLIEGDLRVWDSFAILEYLAEHYPEKKLWPENPAERAWARAISAEMHAGFESLRTEMSFAPLIHRPIAEPTAATRADIERIEAIWTECRRNFQTRGPFLFGHFTIADAMYAPVVSRFQTYAVSLRSPFAAAYVDHISSLAAFQEWIAGARAEKRG